MLVMKFGKNQVSALKKVKRCNILVVGNSGVGKTTLISSLFNKPLANDVTTKISETPYTVLGSSIAIYDTLGLERETKQQKHAKHEISKFIEQQGKKEPEEQIHAIWYCIDSHVARQSDLDINWIKSISEKLPVIAVITKADGFEKEWLEGYLDRQQNLIQCVVPILAKDSKQRKAFGLDSLLNKTSLLLESIAEKAIINAVESKASNALGWCRDGCTKVLAFNLLPIPVPGVKAMTIPVLQTWMYEDITKAFDCQFSNKFTAKLVSIEIGINCFKIDNFISDALRNISFDYNNIQSVKDVLSYLANYLQSATDL